MLSWALIILIVAVQAAVVGFVAPSSANVAKWLCVMLVTVGIVAVLC